MLVCAACGQENPDIAKFCLACATPLAAEPPPADEERKTVTAVFTDVVGSTARAEQLDPEDVRAMLAPYYARLRRELERHGGTVEKFIGDAVVGLFGAPVAHEDDPERAVRAALAIGEAVAELNAAEEWLDLKIRTGVNTGEALVVLGASAVEGEGMAAGDVMNTAARIQSGAPVNGIAVGEQTYRATQHVFEYQEVEPIQAKGKAEPVRIWQVVGVRDGDGVRPISRSRLVGRDDELARLVGRWERVQSERRRSAAVVVGPPGIGKSRLLAELVERVGPEAGVHRGRCLSYGEGITYWPVAEIVKSAAGILQSDGEAVMSAKLDALLGLLSTTDQDELRTIAAAMANLVGAAASPRGTYSTVEISRAELHWGVRRLLELLAHERPLLVIFEDLHWAEPTLLELIRFLLEGEAEAPFLVLGSARPELLDASRELVTGEVLELEALSAEESVALVEGLAGTAVDAPVAEALVARTGGNPLFLEEMVRMLVEEGLLADGVRPHELPVPANVQALIGSRLDRLATGEKRVAQHAAVVGLQFWPGAVAYVGQVDDVEPGLAELERRDFVHRSPTSSIAGEREYSFRHALIRDVAYGRLPKGRRAELHLRFADWTEALPGGEEDFVEFVAYHLEQSCRFAREVARSPVPPPVDRAVDALTRAAEKAARREGGREEAQPHAAEKAERREGVREAARFYERALELCVREDSEQQLDLRLRRARIVTIQGELRKGSTELEAVAADAERLGRLDLRCAALLVLANVGHRQGNASEARRQLSEAESLLAAVGDDRLRIRALFSLAALKSDFDALYDEAVEHLTRAIDLANELGDPALLVEAHLRMGYLLRNRGDLAAAEDELRRCIESAGDLGSRRDEARAALLLGVVRYYRGDVAEAERIGLEAERLLQRTGEPYFQLQNAIALARIALVRGDAKLAEQRLREALPTALEEGGWLLVETYRLLTDALVQQGRLEDAGEIEEFAGRNLPEGYEYARAAALLARASVAAARADAAEARALFDEAVHLLDRLQLGLDLCEARVAYAQALHMFGDVHAARDQIEKARPACTRMGANGVLAAIDRAFAGRAEGAGAAGPL